MLLDSPIHRALLDACRGPAPLLRAGERTLVACSGGADSVALLLGLAELAAGRPELGLALLVGHVDHALREGSSAESAGVARLCERLGIPFASARLDPDAMRPQLRREGLEAAAREARYRALVALARAAGCGAIATAHTRRDQAETVLLRLARGGGLGALAGIRPERPLDGLRLVRPLLDVGRADTEALCAARSIPPTDDAHNRDPRRSRARLRLAFDELSGLLNPSLDQALVGFATVAHEEDDLLAQLAQRGLEAALAAAEQPEAAADRLPAAFDPGPWRAALLSPDAAPPLHLALGPLRALPEPLLRRALLLAALRLHAAPERLHLEQLAAQVREGRGAVALPSGATARIAGGTLTFATTNRRGAAPRPAPPLPIPGPGLYCWMGLSLTVRLAPNGAPDVRPLPEVSDATGSGRSPLARLAANPASRPLPWRIRARSPGDRIVRPDGRPGRLSDAWSERGVPADLRPVLPLLQDANGAVFFAPAVDGCVETDLSSASCVVVEIWASRKLDSPPPPC